MKETVLMSAAKKARIALAVLAVCGFTLAGAQEAFAECNVQLGSNILCGGTANTALMGVAIGGTLDNAAAGVAIGLTAYAGADNSNAYGFASKATGVRSVALGNESIADEENTVSVGRKETTITDDPFYGTYTMPALYRKIVNMADGVDDHDAATVGQVKSMIAAGGAGSITTEKFNEMLKKDETFKKLQAGGNIITTAPDSQWAANLGTGKIEAGNKDLVNGGTVFDKVGDTGKLTAAGLTSNKLSDAIVEVNDKTKQNAEDIKNVNGRVDELGGAVSKLDTKVNKVGAGAAALAALHPMEFDSDNKLTFAAGVGSYHGASAAAIGAFYRPSEQVMFSIAGNMGNGENMVNAGVSFALDRPSKTPTTKAALVKTVVAQNEQIAALNETLAEQNEKIARLEAMVEKLAAKQNA